VALLSIVVVPARDEEHAIGRCLEALAEQTVPADAFETIVVADGCVDRTEAVARTAAERLGLRLTVLHGPGAGSGPARRLGMDAAAERLEALGSPGGLIATTDADSAPLPDWLARQLDHLSAGAGVIAGLIVLDEAEAARLPQSVTRRRELDAVGRMAQVKLHEPGAEHHHFAGASLGVSAEIYRRVGGLEPSVALEDEAFSARLREHGVPVLHAADVVVRTSARNDGRARRGLSVDLAVSTWRERRRYKAAAFPVEMLRAAKGRTQVSVVIPTKECAATVGGVLQRTVEPLREAGLVDELLVIDAGLSDGTAALAAARGARVVDQGSLLAECGPALGKGDAMWRALHATTGELVCFLDGDTRDPDPKHLSGLLGPLLLEPEIALVKGAFARPLRQGERLLADEGGRVTELMARPLLNLHVPLLAGFAQPLAGEFAARRELLERLPFPVGYGVEIAVMIDALRECGLDALAECDLGTRQNRHQPLRSLGEMAFAVLAAVERRLDGPRSATGGQYLKPWDGGAVATVPIAERPPLCSLVSRAA
jgi:glycosyltransferase involved in cell wall biosynthesis